MQSAEAGKSDLSTRLAAAQTAVCDRDAALDALADELVVVSGLCDTASAARDKAEEQVGVGVGGSVGNPGNDGGWESQGAALDARTEETVAVSGLCDAASAARAEEQVNDGLGCGCWVVAWAIWD